MKEKILKLNHKVKTITLCAWCEGKYKSITSKWDKKGYTISHGMCKECSKKNE